MRATSLFPHIAEFIGQCREKQSLCGRVFVCVCVCVGGWVGELVFVCVCMCVCGVCVWGGGGGKWERNGGRGRDVHTAAVTQRERRERREGGDL